MANKIKESKRDDLRILNLFAYTGGATMACSKAGAKEVVHVDAAKGMIQWGKRKHATFEFTRSYDSFYCG